MRVIACLWALPNTLIGLALVPLVSATGGGVQWVDGVLELQGRAIAWLLTHCVPLPNGAAAMTLGHVVIARDRDALRDTRAHERLHVRQCERWGPLFLPAYLLAAAWGFVSGRGAYAGNYFECHARNGSEIR